MKKTLTSHEPTISGSEMHVVDSHTKDLQNLLSVLLVVALFFLVLFGYLYRNIQMSSLKYDISRLQHKERQLFLEVEDLRLRIAKQSRARRVEKLFRERYGYVPVQVSQKITSVKLPKFEIKQKKARTSSSH